MVADGFVIGKVGSGDGVVGVDGQPAGGCVIVGQFQAVALAGDGFGGVAVEDLFRSQVQPLQRRGALQVRDDFGPHAEVDPFRAAERGDPLGRDQRTGRERPGRLTIIRRAEVGGEGGIGRRPG